MIGTSDFESAVEGFAASSARVMASMPPDLKNRLTLDEPSEAVPATELTSNAVDGADDPTSSDRPRNHVLVIASRFPPVASVGALRVRKFVKYLGRFGWRPVVMTGAMHRDQPSSHDARRATDETSLHDLPDRLPVYRLSPVVDDWPHHWSRAWAHRLSPLSGWLGRDARTWMPLFKWRFQHVHDRFAFPDRGIWRLPSALSLAIRLHRRYRFKAVFSTGMPFSDHMIGLALRRILRRPWLADFRDPWVEYVHWQQWKTQWGRRLTRMAEAAVVRQAERVISVNDTLTQRFIDRYPAERSDKFVTISNGFDPPDFESRRRARADKVFRLVYAGSLYGTRSPQKVLEAFERFLSAVPGRRRHARFDFLGRPGSYIDLLRNRAFGDTVRYRGMLPHGAALGEMAAADLNVVLLPNIPGSASDTTTKLYECLGSGRPILAAVPANGAAARVLRTFDGVTRCEPDDVAGMADAMTQWYQRWLEGGIEVRRSAHRLEPLTRFCQTRQLAKHLDAVADRQRTPRSGVR